MKKTALFRIILLFTIPLIVLSGALVLHILSVSKPRPTRPMIQLARIDFQQKIDSLEAQKIVAFVNSQNGIDKAYFNVPDQILVFGFLVDEQNATAVFNKVIEYGNYKATKYVVDKEMASNGCPVIDKTSFAYKVSESVNRILE